jgi:hypothetical protein
MLRWTNRLQDHLESRGEALFKWAKGSEWCYRKHHIREAEFASNAWGGGEQVIPPPFTFSMLKRIMYQGCRFHREILIQKSEENPEEITVRTENDPGDEGGVDILWLSNTEFITSLAVIRFFDRVSHYSLVISSKDDSALESMDNSLGLLVYSVGQLFSKDEKSDGLAFKFLDHVLGQSTEMRVDIDFSQASVLPSVESVLSVIPTSAQSLMKCREIRFTSRSKELISAFSSFPFHRNVRLCFPERYSRFHFEASNYLELNNLLGECKHLRHLQVHHDILAATSAPLIVSPALESLTLELYNSPLLDKIADGVFTSIKQMAFEWHSTPTSIGAQLWFDQNTACFCSRASNCLRMSSLRFGTRAPIKSNFHWDTGFFPVLVINWLHDGEDGYPATTKKAMIGSLTGLAVQAINRGVIFAKTTNVIPLDLSVSNASAAFAVLRNYISGKKSPRNRNV